MADIPMPGSMAGATAARTEYPIKRIIFASSLGTMIEWYDFYIFGSLATVMSALLFPGKDPTWDLIKYWALFATGFIVRPFGAIVFGRIGDLIGRKYAFMVTLSIMGLSKFLLGCLPTYATIGLAAPFLGLAPPLHLPARRSRRQGIDVAGSLQGVGLAHSVPAVDHPRGHVVLHPHEARGVAALRRAQEPGEDLHRPAQGSVRQLGELQDRPARP